MAINENPLSEDDKESFKERQQEVTKKVKEGISKFTTSEILTDGNLLKGLNGGDDNAPASKSKPKPASTRTVVADDDDEFEEEEAEDEEEPEEEDDDSESEEDDDDESEESDDEEEDEDDADEDDSEEEDGDEEESDDDELDPKSKKKVNKRFARMTAENKALEAEVERMRKELDRKDDDKESKDPDWKNLEKIWEEQGEAGIEQLQDEIAVATRKAKTDEDALKLQKLNRLSNKFLAEAPARFQKKQVRAFQEAVVDTQKTLGKDKFAAGAKEIFALANQIFSRSNTLKKAVDGQAEAWRLASEHYSELLKKPRPEDKDEKLRLKRQVNKLKAKTSLDAKKIRGEQKTPKVDLKKMRSAARSGDTETKLAYVKEAFDIDSLIPDDLRG